MRARSNISNLGLVASHKRTIKPGTEYNQYFDLSQVKNDEVTLTESGDVYDTLKLMQKVVKKTLPQTKKIAQKLRGATTEETCRNIWNFLYNNIQYKKDNPLREQLRTPVRSWKDRATGIDCDCYAIFASSILTNLGISNAFRMAAYKKDFQHVYVVVNANGKTITIDPVLDAFNEEAPYSKKYDHTMSKVSMLNGIGDAACITKPVFDRLRRYISTEEVRERGYVPTQQFLEKNNIPYIQDIDKETDGGIFQINTPGGIQTIKPIITKAESQEILDALSSSYQVTVTTQPSPQPPATIPVQADADSMKKFPWLWVAAAVLGSAILLTGSEDRPAPRSLEGVPKKLLVKKRTKAKSKLKTMYA